VRSVSKVVLLSMSKSSADPPMMVSTPIPPINTLRAFPAVNLSLPALPTRMLPRPLPTRTSLPAPAATFLDSKRGAGRARRRHQWLRLLPD